MKPRRLIRTSVRWLGAGVGLAALGYGAWVATAWGRYGRARPAADPEARDPLLDRFMPEYEVAERHRIDVRAPADVTLQAATETDLQRSPVVSGIIDARARLLGSRSAVRRPVGLLDEVRSLGWRVLAETPGREIVLGAVTQPWKGDVVFRGLPPAEFTAFRVPGYAKIAWTLRADPAGPGASVFRTETRVATTDESARRRFRWYWARFSPGIVLIRRVLLGLVKQEAERRQRPGAVPVEPIAPVAPFLGRSGS